MQNKNFEIGSIVYFGGDYPYRFREDKQYNDKYGRIVEIDNNLSICVSIKSKWKTKYLLSNLHHINTKKEHIERIQEIKGIELDFIYYPIIINKKGEQFSMGFVYSKEEIKRKLYCILKNGKISFDTFKCIKIMYEDYPSVYDFNNFLKYLEIENIKLSEEELFYILSDFKK